MSSFTKEISLLSRRDFLRAGAATLAGSSILGLAGCNAAALDPNTDSYELNVQLKEFTVNGLTARTRTYGSIPGPTIYTAPGRRLRITVNNNLPPNPPPGDGGSSSGGGGHMHAPSVRAAAPPHNENDPHDFNTTNLHVHGIQVRPHLFEPVGTSDPSAKMIGIGPGSSHTYDFEIPENQPSGLYWYHPHHHGSTALQVYNGMAGLLVVRGPIDEVPEIKAAREQFVAVQRLRISPSTEDPNIWVNDPVAFMPPNEGGFTEAQKRNFFLVNGEPVAYTDDSDVPPTVQLGTDTILMEPGEVLRFRFLNGTDSQLMPIKVEGHQMHVIAYDGINLLQPVTHEEVEVPPGGRLEFLIKAGEPGTYALHMPDVIGKQFQNCFGFRLANITVSGPQMDMALPTSLPMPTREYPVIPESEIVGSQNLHFHSVFPDPTLYTGVGFHINDKAYGMERIDHTVRLNTAEEWTLTAADDEGHPFHLHVNSFWVMEVNGVPLDPPVKKDVVWIPKGGSVKIRMRFKSWTGKSVYHCHILFHEDTGMMQNFMITR